MTWFRTDDGFWRHRKVRRLGRDKVFAVGVWQLAGSHAADELSDGFVPHVVIAEWDPDGAMTARLIEVGLWEPAHVEGEDGIRFHDWLDYNPSREKVLADREKERLKKERMRAGLAEKRRRNSRSARPRGTPSGTPSGVPVGSPALPDPGSLPSSGTPAAAAGGGAPAAVPAEHVPTSSPEVRAAARHAAALKPPRRRSRHAAPGDRPLVASVAQASSTGPPSRPDPRAEQDRLAELDAVHAVSAAPDERVPPSSDASGPPADLREQETA